MTVVADAIFAIVLLVIILTCEYLNEHSLIFMIREKWGSLPHRTLVLNCLILAVIGSITVLTVGIMFVTEVLWKEAVIVGFAVFSASYALFRISSTYSGS
jgi:hypothetical protein